MKNFMIFGQKNGVFYKIITQNSVLRTASAVFRGLSTAELKSDGVKITKFFLFFCEYHPFFENAIVILPQTEPIVNVQNILITNDLCVFAKGQ